MLIRPLRLLALLCALLGVYLILAALQLGSFSSRADTVAGELRQEQSALSEAAQPFQADYSLAVDLSQTLDQRRAAVASLQEETRQLRLPSFISNSAAAEYQQALADYALVLVERIDWLGASVESVERRDSAFSEVIHAFEGLSALPEGEATVDEVRDVVKSVREDLDLAIGRLRSETASAPVLYSNNAILWRLSELSSRLRAVEAATKKGDVEQTERRLASFAQLAGSDWRLPFERHDTEAVSLLADQGATLLNAGQRMDAAAEAVTAAQYRMLSAAIPLVALSVLIMLADYIRPVYFRQSDLRIRRRGAQSKP